MWWSSPIKRQSLALSSQLHHTMLRHEGRRSCSYDSMSIVGSRGIKIVLIKLSCTKTPWLSTRLGKTRQVSRSVSQGNLMCCTEDFWSESGGGDEHNVVSMGSPSNAAALLGASRPNPFARYPVRMGVKEHEFIHFSELSYAVLILYQLVSKY